MLKIQNLQKFVKMQKVKVSFSDMFSSGDMHEESEGVVGLLPALAALEGVLEPVVLHV